MGNLEQILERIEQVAQSQVAPLEAIRDLLAQQVNTVATDQVNQPPQFHTPSPPTFTPADTAPNMGVVPAPAQSQPSPYSPPAGMQAVANLVRMLESPRQVTQQLPAASVVSQPPALASSPPVAMSASQTLPASTQQQRGSAPGIVAQVVQSVTSAATPAATPAEASVPPREQPSYGQRLFDLNKRRPALKAPPEEQARWQQEREALAEEQARATVERLATTPPAPPADAPASTWRRRTGRAPTLDLASNPQPAPAPVEQVVRGEDREKTSAQEQTPATSEMPANRTWRRGKGRAPTLDAAPEPAAEPTDSPVASAYRRGRGRAPTLEMPAPTGVESVVAASGIEAAPPPAYRRGRGRAPTLDLTAPAIVAEVVTGAAPENSAAAENIREDSAYKKVETVASPPAESTAQPTPTRPTSSILGREQDQQQRSPSRGMFGRESARTLQEIAAGTPSPAQPPEVAPPATEQVSRVYRRDRNARLDLGPTPADPVTPAPATATPVRQPSSILGRPRDPQAERAVARGILGRPSEQTLQELVSGVAPAQPPQPVPPEKPKTTGRVYRPGRAPRLDLSPTADTAEPRPAGQPSPSVVAEVVRAVDPGAYRRGRGRAPTLDLTTATGEMPSEAGFTNNRTRTNPTAADVRNHAETAEERAATAAVARNDNTTVRDEERTRTARNRRTTAEEYAEARRAARSSGPPGGGPPGDRPGRNTERRESGGLLEELNRIRATIASTDSPLQPLAEGFTRSARQAQTVVGVIAQIGRGLAAVVQGPLGLFQRGLDSVHGQLQRAASVASGLFNRGYNLTMTTVGIADPVGVLRLQYAFRDLSAVIGFQLAPVIRFATGAVREFADWLYNLDTATQRQLGRWIIWGTALAGVVMIAPRVVGAFSAITTAVRMMAGSFGLLGAATGILGALAVVGGLAAVGSQRDEPGRLTEEGGTRATATGIERITEVMRPVGEVINRLLVEMQPVLVQLGQSLLPVVQSLANVLTPVLALFARALPALTPVLQLAATILDAAGHLLAEVAEGLAAWIASNEPLFLAVATELGNVATEIGRWVSWLMSGRERQMTEQQLRQIADGGRDEGAVRRNMHGDAVRDERLAITAAQAQRELERRERDRGIAQPTTTAGGAGVPGSFPAPGAIAQPTTTVETLGAAMAGIVTRTTGGQTGIRDASGNVRTREQLERSIRETRASSEGIGGGGRGGFEAIAQAQVRVQEAALRASVNNEEAAARAERTRQINELTTLLRTLVAAEQRSNRPSLFGITFGR